MKNPESVLITGASRGIGAALAEAYAAPGVTLTLCGRDKARLEASAGRCRARGAAVATAAFDVTDAAAAARSVNEAASRAPLDLLIANAGISGGTEGGEGADQVRRIFAVNLDGVLNTVLPAISAMRARGRGQIALMSSLAGFRGFPGAPAYSASKAAVRTWGEALRGALRRDGIEVSVVCPGFVRSPITAVNPYPMPLIMDAERAARIIKARLGRNCARIAFPWPLYLAVWAFGALSPGLTDPLFARLPKKGKLAKKV